MSDGSSSSSAIGRKRRLRSKPLSSESGTPDDSPVVSRKGKTSKRVITESSDSEIEEKIGKRRRKSSGAKPVIISDSENDSGSLENEAMCPICLDKMYETDLKGRPGSCEHTFCLECIRTWSKNDSTCVLCRIPFTKLKVVFRGSVLEELPVEEVSLKLDESSIHAYFHICYVCRDRDDEDSVLFCDQCGASYHPECLNPPLLNVPQGQWSCPQCELTSSEDESDDDFYVPHRVMACGTCRRSRWLPRSGRQTTTSRRAAGSARRPSRTGRAALAERN